MPTSFGLPRRVRYKKSWPESVKLVDVGVSDRTDNGPMDTSDNAAPYLQQAATAAFTLLEQDPTIALDLVARFFHETLDSDAPASQDADREELRSIAAQMIERLAAHDEEGCDDVWRQIAFKWPAAVSAARQANASFYSGTLIPLLEETWADLSGEEQDVIGALDSDEQLEALIALSSKAQLAMFGV